MKSATFANTLVLTFAVSTAAAHVAWASQTTKPPATPPTGAAEKPADLLDADALTETLFSEGQKIELECRLIHKKDKRFRLRSIKSGREYKILENSLLEAMIKHHRKNNAQKFSVTVRVTVFQKENFVFVTKVRLN